METKSLYVGNIPYSTTEDELRDLYDQWGPVVDVRLIEGRGFAFVELPAENAQDAIDGTNGEALGGRPLTVNEARPRTERGGGRRRDREGWDRGGGEDRRGGWDRDWDNRW